MPSFFDIQRNTSLFLFNRLRKEAARRSVIMKDQPQDAKELTVFWVEYVMRHNGASHLRCPAVDMTWLVCHI
ncbi:hypothetical protein Pmani_021312 [Petrolisthes manimaculis]|uniref:Uncharacterized protein n=1 Tax=Petrolisthes manimaculis TaxID=1843537 RepID=A0AAE1U1T0_9EUCA|nr:hypothetical protein Pmani_021312 [Petrolisthes manimaculis]